jgi:hypothetical protein
MATDKYHVTTNLDWSSLEKDIGVLVDNQLNFEEEICYFVAGYNKIVDVILRPFLHLNEKSVGLLNNNSYAHTSITPLRFG